MLRKQWGEEFRMSGCSNSDFTFPFSNADLEKREAVKAALLHSWEGYKKFAWGTDELMPQVVAFIWIELLLI